MKNRRKWIKLDSSLTRMARLPAPLLFRAEGSAAPSAAYIRINPRSRRVDAVIDSRRSPYATLAQHRGNVVMIPVPANVSGAALLGFCRSHSVQALMRCVCDGWVFSVDGRGRFYGVPDDAAANALVELYERAKKVMPVESRPNQLSLVWPESEGPASTCIDVEFFDTCADVRSWFGAAGVRDLWPEGVPFDAAVERLFDEALGEGIRFEYGREGIEDALGDLAALQLSDCPETLSAHYVHELLKAQQITDEEAQRWSQATLRSL